MNESKKNKTAKLFCLGKCNAQLEYRARIFVGCDWLLFSQFFQKREITIPSITIMCGDNTSSQSFISKKY